jgi:hypothetical protein
MKFQWANFLQRVYTCFTNMATQAVEGKYIQEGGFGVIVAIKVGSTQVAESTSRLDSSTTTK